MNILILKLGATGDVVRTSTLLRRLQGHVTWITSAKNREILSNSGQLRVLAWEDREAALDRHYTLAINLEDTEEVATFVQIANPAKLFGAHLNEAGDMVYTDTSRRWFDLSLISVYGREKADLLKAQNRETYQSLIFGGLEMQFQGEPYVLPEPTHTELQGDVAIAPEGGPVWPMKNWAFFGELKNRLEERGLIVNVLPTRRTLLEHLGDVSQHRCLVSGDSLPMHLALGTQTRCVTLFSCTSPWEIFDYGIQTKLVSPLLLEYFYKRGFDRRATTAIGVDEVHEAVLKQLQKAQ